MHLCLSTACLSVSREQGINTKYEENNNYTTNSLLRNCFGAINKKTPLSSCVYFLLNFLLTKFFHTQKTSSKEKLKLVCSNSPSFCLNMLNFPSLCIPVIGFELGCCITSRSGNPSLLTNLSSISTHEIPAPQQVLDSSCLYNYFSPSHLLDLGH